MTERLRATGYGERPGLLRRTFRRIQHARFAAFAPAVDVWLPMSEACRDSLVRDYGVDAARCVVTRAPQSDVDTALAPRDPRERPWRLLFVGNDFERKGGHLLAAAMTQLPDATLTVVSHDPAAQVFAGPRVRVLAGVKDAGDIARLCREAHLLVHPTFVDHYSLVICEGLARGLPFLVSEGTPAVELVRASGAGRVLPWPLSAAAIAAAVRNWMAEPDAHLAAQRNALEFARRALTMERFRAQVAAALAGRALHDEFSGASPLA
jgi:glycosyltransferase involved in cell wall biosynthesis